MTNKLSKEIDLSVSLGDKIHLKNPVMTASGTFGYGIEFKDEIDLNSLGGIVVKGLSLHARQGNPMPRIYETPSGMLNAIGLQNIGVDCFLQKKLPLLKEFNTSIFVNFFGYSIDEYCKVAERLNETSEIAGLEMNISCPNIKKGGIAFGSDPSSAYQVISKVRKVTSHPLIVKLSPNVTDIVTIAKAAEEAGADGLSLINTLVGMSIDIKARRSHLANMTGGLSGPAIKPVALRMVWQTAKAVKIPVIGMGGIVSANDALEFIIAGASAVQVGTANFINPAITKEIVNGIEQFCKDNAISSLSEIRGSLQE